MGCRSSIRENGILLGKPEFHSGRRNSNSGCRSFIWEAEVSFGMTEFRLRQYSPIQFISIAGIGTTPFGRDRRFQHPEDCRNRNSGIPFPAQLPETEFQFGEPEFHFGKPKFHSGSRSFIWDDGVPTPSIFSNSVNHSCRNWNYSLRS